MNQVKVTGATANFTAVSSYTNAGYQWQMNTVSGFTPVTNGGQYAGATTSVLTVSNVSGINHGQQYRCVINAGNCVDSSAIVQLNVTNPSGIAKSELTDKVSVYPNPVSSYAFVKSDKNLSFSIISITGQRIPLDTIQKTDSNTYVLDLSMLQEGIYFMELTSEEGQSTVRKLIKLSGF